MTLEKTFQLLLPEPPAHLLEPERVFGGKPPFGRLERWGTQLSGELRAEIPLLGEIKFPFRSRIVQEEEGLARLMAWPQMPADSEPQFWAELSGLGQIVAGGIQYTLNLRIHARLPEGEKWGGKALRRMAEAAFERTVSRTLEQLGS